MLAGVFPVAPTTFHDNGSLDLASQDNVVDFLADAGADAVCVLANYSEQFSLTDHERELVAERVLARAAGRLPVIITASHFSARVAAERARRAAGLGAAMVMLMPPYHGATMSVPYDQVRAYFHTVAEAVDIPIMVQDAPMSTTRLSAAELAGLAREIPNITHVKAEMPGAADKLRAVIELAGDALPGPCDGEESVTLLPDLDAGAVGTMPSCTLPEVLVRVVRAYRSGDRDTAVDLWERHLPLIHYENRQCGLRAAKALMYEGGIIASEATRSPLTPLPPPVRAGLLDHARRRDPLILSWAGRRVG
ncbi:MAG TPA: dihydrodipicolinate synthase family protein [Streptosporangiaceae bacterium]|jgi:dihydrodipicolinate synthase/N-acetylneuraminate lyase